MNVLVIGSGAREHALAWKIASSPRVKDVFVAPGNAGTASIARNLNIVPTDKEALGKAAVDRHIDLVVIGPESSLASGIVDHLNNLGISAFGPTMAASQIEASKVFARKLMQKYGIPLAKGITCSSYAEARNYIRQHSLPLVIKADGLAAGKGVIIVDSLEAADKTLHAVMNSRIFGTAGEKVVIEEYINGREVSMIVFTDGKTVLPMPPTCDYKKIYDDDHGPNTGGMGSYCPPAFFSSQMKGEAINRVLAPAVKAMDNEGILYKGVLYAGLILAEGNLSTLEFNARFGDPETQSILPLLKTDLVDICQAVIENKLDQIDLEWRQEACVGVVMASAGYPGNYRTGFPIHGLDVVDEDIMVFHAGTKSNECGTICTNGGRVLTVVGTGRNIAEARDKVYRNVSKIHFEGCNYRKDIALREIA
jgi:phosphoribosylamine--glycine ligase